MNTGDAKHWKDGDRLELTDLGHARRPRNWAWASGAAVYGIFRGAVRSYDGRLFLRVEVNGQVGSYQRGSWEKLPAPTIAPASAIAADRVASQTISATTPSAGA